MALLSAVSIKIVIYLLPLFPILAIITARCLLRLPATNSRWLPSGEPAALHSRRRSRRRVALPLLPGSVRDALPPQALALLDIVAGAPVLGGVCLIFALLLFKATDRSQPRGALLTLVLFTTVFVQPMALYTAPSLDPVMSPKAQAEIIGAHAKEGYHPLSYRVYPGTYTFYAGTQLEEITQRDWALLDAALSAHPRAVIAMRLDDWERWAKPPCPPARYSASGSSTGNSWSWSPNRPPPMPLLRRAGGRARPDRGSPCGCGHRGPCSTRRSTRPRCAG